MSRDNSEYLPSDQDHTQSRLFCVKSRKKQPAMPKSLSHSKLARGMTRCGPPIAPPERIGAPRRASSPNGFVTAARLGRSILRDARKMDDTTTTLRVRTQARARAIVSRAKYIVRARNTATSRGLLGETAFLSHRFSLRRISPLANDIFILSCHNSNDATRAASIKPPGQIVRPPLLRPFGQEARARARERFRRGQLLQEHLGIRLER